MTNSEHGSTSGGAGRISYRESIVTFGNHKAIIFLGAKVIIPSFSTLPFLFQNCRQQSYFKQMCKLGSSRSWHLTTSKARLLDWS
jgi:hypothetical protein